MLVYFDMQDASSYANSNATEIRARVEVFGGDVTVSFGYANILLVVAVLYLAWEQGYMLASRLLACRPAKILVVSCVVTNEAKVIMSDRTVDEV